MGRDRHEFEKRGGRRVKTFDPRPLQLKIRVTARKGLIKSRGDLLGVIEHVIQTGLVPDGVVIHWMDWKKGEGGEAHEGRIDRNLAKELQAFWGALAAADSTLHLLRPKDTGGKGGRRPQSPRSKGGR